MIDEINEEDKSFVEPKLSRSDRREIAWKLMRLIETISEQRLVYYMNQLLAWDENKLQRWQIEDIIKNCHQTKEMADQVLTIIDEKIN